VVSFWSGGVRLVCGMNRGIPISPSYDVRFSARCFTQCPTANHRRRRSKKSLFPTTTCGTYPEVGTLESDAPRPFGEGP